LLLQSLAKEKVVQQALGKNAELLLKSPIKRPPPAKKNDEDDLFKLPELPAASAGLDNTGEGSEQDTSASASDSSFDESTARHAYNSSLQAIDVKSQHFRNLPADVRHEILTDIKETRKQSSWGRLHELPGLILYGYIRLVIIRIVVLAVSALLWRRRLLLVHVRGRGRTHRARIT